VSISTTSATESVPDHDRRARMDALFTSHAADVFAFALRRSSPQAAQDTVSETFLVAWRRLDSVPDTPKPWLLGVARRVLANQRRTDGRQIALRTRLRSPALRR
jgi:RNA polymerase sigma-70 factor, ECF subfamily